MQKKALLSVLLLFNLLISSAQDTLPDFSVLTRGNNRILISWNNNFESIKQISIQRSFDSTRNFKSIMTVPDPNVPQNGFVDTKAPTPFQFYRLFILLGNGEYIFSESKKAIFIAGEVAENSESVKEMENRIVVSGKVNEQEAEIIRQRGELAKSASDKYFVVIRRDSLIARVNQRNFRAFRDSLVANTKDTLIIKTVDTVLLKPFIPREVYRPSKFVFTDKSGHITIALSDASRKKYSIKFYEGDTQLFEIRQITESPLTLDKANFLSGGWFRFELFEAGKLIESHKLFITKDF